jgi:hypothetical protein
LQLGLDQGPELLGVIVTVVGPADGLAGRVDQHTRQVLFLRGSLFGLRQSGAIPLTQEILHAHRGESDSKSRFPVMN